MKKRRRLEESVKGIPKFARVEEEEAIREALQRFMAAIISGVIFVRGSAKEFEVMR